MPLPDIREQLGLPRRAGAGRQRRAGCSRTPRDDGSRPLPRPGLRHDVGGRHRWCRSPTPSLPPTAKTSAPSTDGFGRAASARPWTPAADQDRDSRMSITVQLQNTTSSDVRHVALSAGTLARPIFGARGDTVSVRRAKLDIRRWQMTFAARRDCSRSRPSPAVFTTGVDVPAHGDRPEADVHDHDFHHLDPLPGTLCLCANAVYPIYLSAIETQSGAVEGFARTYLVIRPTGHALDQVNHQGQRLPQARRGLGLAADRRTASPGGRAGVHGSGPWSPGSGPDWPARQSTTGRSRMSARTPSDDDRASIPDLVDETRDPAGQGATTSTCQAPDARSPGARRFAAATGWLADPVATRSWPTGT